MSKLTEYQIRAMIGALERQLQRADRREHPATVRRTQEKLAMYRAELAEIEKTATLGRSNCDKSLSFQQTTIKKALTHERFPEVKLNSKKDALAIAGDQVVADNREAFEVAKWIGRQQAFGMLGNKCSAAQAEILKRLRDSSAHKSFGLTREEFCDQHLGISRQTADRIIANYEEFGAQYFAMSSLMRISPATYRLLAGAVTDSNELQFGDEKIPITKANAERIMEAVNAIREDLKQKAQQLSDAKGDLKTARQERDNAKKAAEKSRQDLADLKRREAEAFPDATDRQKRLLRAQTQINFACQLISGVSTEADLDDTERGWIEGLCAYGVKMLIEITGHDPFMAAQLKGRDLLAEYMAEKSDGGGR